MSVARIRAIFKMTTSVYVPGDTQCHDEEAVTSSSCLDVYCCNIQDVADLGRVAGFQWDEGNARKSFDKHSVSQAEAEQVFFNEPLLVVEDVKHSRLESRFHALGVNNSRRRLPVTFTLRRKNTKIRVISARDMHSKERSRYGKET